MKALQFQKLTYLQSAGWLTLAFALPVIVLLYMYANLEAFDEHFFHLAAVRQIALHWPSLDLVTDSVSASPPFYHWLLAGLGKVTGTSLLSYRLWNVLATAIMLAGLFLWLRTYCLPDETLLLMLPLVACSYILKSAVWVMTDNIGMMFLTLMLLVMLRDRPRHAVVAAATMLAAAMILSRQIYMWALMPMFVWIASEWAVSRPWLRSAWPQWQEKNAASPFPMRMIVWTLLPLLALSWLLVEWKGIVPPKWRGATLSVTMLPIAYACTLAALFAPLLMPGKVWKTVQEKTSRIWIAVGACGGLYCAIIGASTPDLVAGRWGGYVWSIVDRLPVYYDRSLLFIILAPAGGAVLMLLARFVYLRATKCAAMTWGAAMVGWLSSSVINRQVFQRYYEPPMLLMLITGCVIGGISPLTLLDKLKLTALFCIQLAITLFAILPPRLNNVVPTMGMP